MQYFKNVELAKLHSVSEGTVRRWIDAARNGKVELQLYERDGRFHVANTAKNEQCIKELVQKGKKHANSRWHRIVTPQPEFYELYNKRQIVDLITNIDIHKEIPSQYGYFDKGATAWDTYAQRLWRVGRGNTITATVELLQSNSATLDQYFENYERINVIDICIGNALPVKELLTHLLYDQGQLGRYIGIDISKEMLDIAQRNIHSWFEGKVAFEGYARDISYERFDDLLVDEDPDTTLNLVLLLGGTLNNFRSPNDILKVIYSSMGSDDLFATSMKLDSEETRRYFDFHAESGIPELPLKHRLMVDRLGIDESTYDVIQGFDETLRARFISIIPKLDLTLQFKVGDKDRFVTLKKDEPILLWRAWHQNTLDAIHQLDRNNFSLVEASTTDDQQYLLTISKIRSNPQPSLG